MNKCRIAEAIMQILLLLKIHVCLIQWLAIDNRNSYAKDDVEMVGFVVVAPFLRSGYCLKVANDI